MPAILESQRAVYLAPLTSFYNKAGRAFPDVRFLHGEVVPDPYRHLLVHHSDMTPRLQAFHGIQLDLDVLTLALEEPLLVREVLLRRSDNHAPVEFGAISIHLDQLPERVADPIRRAERPLGGILEAEKFKHLSAPRAYFETKADALMAKLLHAEEGQRLYGRCNVLALVTGEVFAEIVEILPPVDSLDGNPSTLSTI